MMTDLYIISADGQAKSIATHLSRSSQAPNAAVIPKAGAAAVGAINAADLGQVGS
jgi:hypothetical protein